MDFDNLFILLIIFSFIARAVGEALKGGKKPPGEQQGPRMPPRRAERRPLPGPPPQPPPQQRPGRLQPAPRDERLEPQPRSRAPEAGVPDRALPPVETRPAPAPERASDMIPEELWEILTGQRRAPAPAPRPVPDEADEDEELIPDEESLLVPETSREDQDAAELIRRRREAVARRERGPEIYRPKVISLETEPLPTAARHVAFHGKHEEQAPAKVLRRGPAGGLARFAGTEPGALRRAIILKEVLGPPKGLE